MKKSELLKQIGEAKVFGFFGEYRGSKTDPMAWVDKKSGKRMEGNTIRHNVETGVSSEAVAINEFASDDFDPAKFTMPYKKGQAVFVNVTSFAIEKGVKSCRGTMIPVED